MDGEPLANPVERAAGVTHLRALGTTVTLALDRNDALVVAETILRDELDAIDRACSRFRPDSEIRCLDAAGGRPVRASALLYEAVSVACAVAERTGGVVDPTVGRAVEALGYDRDFVEVPAIGPPILSEPVPAPGWWLIELDAQERSIAVPPGVRLDLGATAKALVADRAARRIASVTDSGALVCVGGDVSVSGPPVAGGWPVGIAVDCARPFGPGPVVSVSVGGLASSSTAVRAWRRGGRWIHHIVDPATGDCASDHWRLVSVAAASCVDANAYSTAAVVWGERAPERLGALGLPARFVRHDGAVSTVAGWPSDPGEETSPARAPKAVGR
jgi:thiamine biosynthesis lipoprotein